MKINDKIYGEIEIENEIILRLINTKPFQRLKEINQYGAVNFVFEEGYQTTRYEHSIGVWYASYKLGGDLETQVAALLHDVGHYAFSHLVDQAHEDASENAHELSLSKLPGWDEVESILAEAGIAIKPVDEYLLIKNSLPDIGTDRLDYAVRDLESVFHAGDHFGKKVIENATLHNGQIAFKDVDVAKEFASRGNKAMWHVIYDPQIAVIYQATIDILRAGLKDGWITEADLLLTDAHVFNLMRQNRDKFESKYFRVFENQFNTVIASDESDADFVHTKLKARYFDPKVLIEGEIKKVSELDAEFKSELNKFIQIFEDRKKGLPIKVIF